MSDLIPERLKDLVRAAGRLAGDGASILDGFKAPAERAARAGREQVEQMRASSPARFVTRRAKPGKAPEKRRARSGPPARAVRGGRSRQPGRHG